MSFETPILFLVFNRPETTRIVFEEIKKLKPKFLFIAADGARTHILAEAEKCKETRDFILESIDWNCEIKTFFRKENLGCGLAVSQAITWFFEHVEQGIILEDDCLPHPSFFSFCEELLEKYKLEDRIFGISGNNFQNGIQRGRDSYYFSHYSHIWGWASWRRAWNLYDYNLTQFEDFKKTKKINKIDVRTVFKNYWFSIFDKVANNQIDTWDYQWLFTVWNNMGLVIAPNVNLVSNIGFGVDATHTVEVNSPLSNMDMGNLQVIKHPEKIKVDVLADRYTSTTVFHIEVKSNMEYYISFFLRKIVFQIKSVLRTIKSYFKF